MLPRTVDLSKAVLLITKGQIFLTAVLCRVLVSIFPEDGIAGFLKLVSLRIHRPTHLLSSLSAEK